MIDYRSFPGLAGVYLEDSYVLGISEPSGELVFYLDAVLTPEHSEHYCYVHGSLVFPGVTHVVWLSRNGNHYTDAAGDEDLGNVVVLTADGDAYVVEGDWGAVRISRAPRFELSE
jgi:hypothetical protein